MELARIIEKILLIQHPQLSLPPLLHEQGKGNVEAAVFKEVDKDPKYQDKNIYRFMLVDGSQTTEWIYTTKTNVHTITNYFLLDRQTENQFDLNVAGVNSDRVFKKAVQKLSKYMNGK